MIRPRRIRPVRQRMSQQAIACAVLPSPMSSARSKPAGGQEPLDALALIGIERPLQALERRLQLGGRQRLLHDPLEPVALADEQGAQRRVVPAVRPPRGGA